MVTNAFLSINAMLDILFLTIGKVLGNKKLALLYQEKESPWVTKNYELETLNILVSLSDEFLNFIVYFLNFSNSGLKNLTY